MKNLNHRLSSALLLLCILLAHLTAFAQITPSQDACINTATAATNYGTAATLGVVSSATSIQTTYIKIDMSSFPECYTSGNVANETLKLYVHNMTTACSVDA